MTRDEERRRGRNAKRLLWVVLFASLLVAGLIAYTSLEAPDPASRSPEGTVPPSAPASSEQRAVKERVNSEKH